MRILTALYGCYMAKIVFYDCHTGVIWLLYGQFFVTKQVEIGRATRLKSIHRL